MSNQYERVSNQDKIGEIVGGRSACFVVCYSFAGLPAGDIAASMTRNTMMQRFDVQHYLNVQLIRLQQKSELLPSVWVMKTAMPATATWCRRTSG